MPENPSQTLEALDSATLSQLRRHGLLRQLINAEVTEELLDADELEPEALGSTTEGLFVPTLVLQKIFVHLDLHHAFGTDAERPPIERDPPIRAARSQRPGVEAGARRVGREESVDPAAQPAVPRISTRMS